MKLNYIYRYSIATILFYIYSVFIFKQSKISEFIEIEYLVIISQLSIFLLSIFFISYPIIFSSIIISSLFYFINDDIRSFYVLNSFLIAFCIKKFNLQIFTGVIVLLAMLFVSSYSIIYDVAETEYFDRFGFGFYSPNLLQYYLLVSLIFLGRKYWSINFLSFAVVANTILSYYTKSLTVLLVVYLIFCFYFFQTQLAKIKSHIYYSFFLFFSILFPIIVNVGGFNYPFSLNLEERLYYAYQSVLNFSIIPYAKYYLVDNYFLNVISVYGILFGFILHYILSRSIIRDYNFLIIPLCLYLVFNNSGSSIDFIMIYFLCFIMKDQFFKRF